MPVGDNALRSPPNDGTEGRLGSARLKVPLGIPLDMQFVDADVFIHVRKVGIMSRYECEGYMKVVCDYEPSARVDGRSARRSLLKEHTSRLPRIQ